MGLFTSTVFNNGTAHTFVERGQIPDAKSIIREYIEPAAAQSAQSKIKVYHDLNTANRVRSLLQRTVYLADSAGILKLVTVNFTVTCAPTHVAADVILEQKLLAAAIADTTFHANFRQGLS